MVQSRKNIIQALQSSLFESSLLNFFIMLFFGLCFFLDFFFNDAMRSGSVGRVGILQMEIIVEGQQGFEGRIKEAG